MHEYQLTVGLFDKATEKQEIPTPEAEAIIAQTLIEKHGIFAYTLIHCSGHYRMNSTGRIISEPSIRLEIVTDCEEPAKIRAIVSDLKTLLNQESIMVKHAVSDISFL